MIINRKLISVSLVSIVFILFLILFSSAASASTTTCYVKGTNYQYWSGEQYPLIDLFGEKYVPLFEKNSHIWESHVDNLSKLVIDSKGRYTLKTGDKLDFGQGYSLQVKQIDVDGKKVWLEFDKDGQYVDDQIISTDSGDHTWTCTYNNLQGLNNVPIMKVHVKQIYQGAKDSIALIDGIWIIDFSNIRKLQVGDTVGEYRLIKIVKGVSASNLGYLIFEIPKPIAAFTASPTFGVKPFKVNFKDDSTGSPTSWKWNFGDGNVSNDQNPVHTYYKAGRYSPSLTVSKGTFSNTRIRFNYIVVM